MKFFVVIFNLLFGAILISYGQGSLQRATIGSIGGSSIDNGILVRQTVGQPYGTITSSNNELVYRPGFQQPLFLIINVRQSIQASIFPNPAAESINIETSVPIYQAYITILDAAGKTIKRFDYEELKICQIDCTTLTNGTYFLIISDNKSDLSTHKLIISR